MNTIRLNEQEYAIFQEALDRISKSKNGILDLSYLGITDHILTALLTCPGLIKTKLANLKILNLDGNELTAIPAALNGFTRPGSLVTCFQ